MDINRPTLIINLRITIEVEKKELSSPSDGAVVPAVSIKPNPTFDVFWDLVPRKVGKGDAMKAFDKALNDGASGLSKC